MLAVPVPSKAVGILSFPTMQIYNLLSWSCFGFSALCCQCQCGFHSLHRAGRFAGRRDDRRDDRRENRRDDRRDDRKDCLSDRMGAGGGGRRSKGLKFISPVSIRTISEIAAGMAKMMTIVEPMRTTRTRKRGSDSLCPDEATVENKQPEQYR